MSLYRHDVLVGDSLVRGASGRSLVLGYRFALGPSGYLAMMSDTLIIILLWYIGTEADADGVKNSKETVILQHMSSLNNKHQSGILDVS